MFSEQDAPCCFDAELPSSAVVPVAWCCDAKNEVSRIEWILELGLCISGERIDMA